MPEIIPFPARPTARPAVAETFFIAGVRVERQPDPRTPGRVAYRLTGPSFEAVQAAAADLMERAVQSRFLIPWNDGFGWVTGGETFAEQVAS